MTIQKQNMSPQPDDITADNTLIHLETERPEAGQAKDINTKIDLLDHSLGDLNSELEAIRSSVEEGLDRLSDTDTDLTSKVSDTYKRLGELDKTYKSLMDISSNIDNEIQKLTGNITEVASHSTAELEKLEATAEVHNSYLTQQNQTLAERVNQLVVDSRVTTSNIQLSIKEVRETILVSEKTLVAEIDVLAGTTKNKNEILSSDIEDSKIEIESSKARIMKCEKVDEALARRASQLEMSSEELSVKSKALEQSVGHLDERTANLTASILALTEHTEALQKESEKHDLLIAEIQEDASEHAQTLFNLGNTVQKHIAASVIAIVLMVAAAYVFYDYQVSDNEFSAAQLVEQTQLIDSKINEISHGIKQEMVEQKMATNEALIGKFDKLNEKLTAVDKSVQQLDDQAQSLDGRLSTVLPFDNFGGDNIIHGSQWLAQLPSNKFIIQLATVADKKELFEIAHRYNRYLTQPVAYYTDANGKYVMFYGEFDSGYSANRVLQSMPSRINWQRPVVMSVSNVQSKISI